MPASILGVGLLRAGNRHIADLWKSLTHPVCPSCDKGILIMQAGEEGQVLDQRTDGSILTLHPWVCHKCGFGLLAPDDPAKARDSAARLRNERVKELLSGMELAEREQIARGHRLHSRTFFLTSALIMCGFLYMIASGATLLLSVNWLAIAFVLWVFGMKRSYRAWQVMTGQLFVSGALWFWFKNEKWLI